MERSRPGPEQLVTTGGLREVARRSAITGIAFVIPLAVTLFVLVFVLDFISRALDPVVGVMLSIPGMSGGLDALVLKVATLLTLVVLVFVVGFLAEFSTRGRRVGEGFDAVMESLPGVGSVYTSFNEMSELLLDSDTDSFKEVVLVEYPGPDSYTLAFKTAETPPVVEDATGAGEMVTLFMPMAPNPVMGGFVIHVSTEKIVEVDLSVEEGIRSIVTSGVAVGEDSAPEGLSAAEMRELGQAEGVQQQVDPGEAKRPEKTQE
jgi:uncharacterized membrane protein